MKYDLCTMLRNVDDKGGLSLIFDTFFRWGTTSMVLVAKELTVDNFSMKGDLAFKVANNAILNHASLRSDFTLLCMRQESGSLLISNESIPKLTYDVTSKVFKDSMTKECNARFGEVVNNYAEQNAMKG